MDTDDYSPKDDINLLSLAFFHQQETSLMVISVCQHRLTCRASIILFCNCACTNSLFLHHILPLHSGKVYEEAGKSIDAAQLRVATLTAVSASKGRALEPSVAPEPLRKESSLETSFSFV